MANTKKRWTADEIEILRKYYPAEGDQVCERLSGRTAKSCRIQASKMEISKNISSSATVQNDVKYVRLWTEAEDKILREYYAAEGSKVRYRLNQRSAESCRGRAAALGLTYSGTRKRGRTEQEDLDLEKELLDDEKERAEHNMLVDLGRNDIGKISVFGTVEVEKYMSIERFSHVMHIGSTVKGRIRPNLTALDAVDAVLPAGTLSGAPKLRACEIIDELEDNKRGIYGGAIGYLDFTGNLDTCIAIRLAFQKNGKVFVRSGAGIVADSVPENEYQECINKAAAVMDALKMAQGGDSL